MGLFDQVLAEAKAVPARIQAELDTVLTPRTALKKAPPTGSEEWRIQHDARRVKPADFAEVDKKMGGNFGKGNIDLNGRSIYVYPDQENKGSYSSLESITITDKKGDYILLPKVSNKGTMLTEDQAVQEYLKTGKYLGKFKSDEEATKYAIDLERRQSAYYENGPGKSIKEQAFKKVWK